MRVGFVGWRGMVGSVLRERMDAEDDWSGIEPLFLSTSDAGGEPPRADAPELADAHDLDALAGLDAIVTCQGGAYTERVWPELRSRGWRGYWIDAASALRMRPEALLVLEPVNGECIEVALERGVVDLIGSNCTMSLMAVAIHGLLERDLVEWMQVATYQAASGAGAAAMRELVAQMRSLGESSAALLDDPASSILDLDRRIGEQLRRGSLDATVMGAPLAGSLIPWIDSAREGGETREEWKGWAELNKLFEREDDPIPVDSTCVRIGTLRCHSQALTMKLRRDVGLEEVSEVLAGANPWVRVVPNNPEETARRLTPAAVTGGLEVAIGRLRRSRIGPRVVSAFTVGDQLLWGAAEPLRCALLRVRERLGVATSGVSA
ncbi:MAG TPA: aspartate-semialdehyde dehydrogenase [Thermoanaerobaculia bacterium]|nr:aspartate-semialdehyde dehydrogenase [Thermoanaerobaculia bacterium]